MRFDALVSHPVRPAAFWPALIALYFMWGSTYLGIAEVVDEFPPLLGIGSRYVVAATVMGIWLLIVRGGRALHRPRIEYRRAIIEGLLLVAVGNGLLSHAEQHVPTGVAALLAAAMPVWVAVLRAIARDTPSTPTRIGIGIGFLGLGALALGGGETISGGDPLLRILWSAAVVVGAASWALGSFIGPRIVPTRDGVVAVVTQMFVGGAAMLIAGAMAGELADVEPLSSYSTSAWLGWIWLVVVGSLIGHSIFVWLLANGPISLVTTYAYVNPIVAVILGWLLRNEPLTVTVVVGGLVVIIGVILVINGERRTRELVEESAEHG